MLRKLFNTYKTYIHFLSFFFFLIFFKVQLFSGQEEIDALSWRKEYLRRETVRHSYLTLWGGGERERGWYEEQRLRVGELFRGSVRMQNPTWSFSMDLENADALLKLFPQWNPWCKTNPGYVNSILISVHFSSAVCCIWSAWETILD